MAEQSLLAKLGLRTGTVGSSSSLAIAFGNSGGTTPNTVHTAANRTGLYADLTGAAEKIGLVIGGVNGVVFTHVGTGVNAMVAGTIIAKNGTTCGISLVPQGGGANFIGSITTVLLSAARTYTLPDASGTFVLQASAFTPTDIIFADGSGNLAGEASLTHPTACKILVGNIAGLIDSAIDLYGNSGTNKQIMIHDESAEVVGIWADNGGFAGMSFNAFHTKDLFFVNLSTSAMTIPLDVASLRIRPSTTFDSTILGSISGATVAMTGQITSTLATGTAPFVIASATLVPNLYVARAALADTVTTIPNLTGPITSVGNATALAAQTGTGSVFVVQNTPTLTTPNIGAATGISLSVSGQLTSTVVTGTAPLVVSSTTVVGNLNVSQLLGGTWAIPGTIGSTTPNTGSFTTIGASGQITSTVSTGTAPLVIASTTVVANLNAATLNGATFSAPGAIGGGTPGTGAFTTITATGTVTAQNGTTVGIALLPQGGAANFTGSLTTVLLTANRTYTFPDANITLSGSAGVLGTNQNIPFTNGSGLLQTAAGLVVVGTPSATAPSTGTNGPGTVNGVQWATSDGASGGYTAATYGNGSAFTAQFAGYACQGTAASPGASIVNDNTRLLLRGHDGTAFTGTSASIALTVASTWSNTNHESYIQFATTPNASTTQAVAGRVDGNQALVLGGPFNSVGTFSAGTLRPHLQTASTATANAGIVQTMWNAGAPGPIGIFAKSRSGTPGTQGVITTGDTLGTMSWQGDDGTNFIAAAQIVGVSTGTIGTGQVPGILKLSTANSAGTMTLGLALDSTSVVVVGQGTAASNATFTTGTVTPKLQVVGSAVNANASINCFAASANSGSFYFAKSRSATINTMTVVTTADTLGTIDFQGADGTNFVSGVRIIASVTGTPGAGQIPGNIVIQTASTVGTLTTALTIDNAQATTLAGTITAAASTDTVNQIGYLKFGLATSGTSTFGYIGNSALFTSSNYLVMQTNVGDSFLNCATGRSIGIRVNNASRLTVANTLVSSLINFSIAPTTVASGVQTAFLVTGAANTNMTLSTEVPDVDFNLARTVQWATGAITTQRAHVVRAPTYAFVGASTITNAATFAITGAPVLGTNATFTNSYALWVQGGNTRLDGRQFLNAAATAPTDADIPTAAVSWYLDESLNNIKVRVRYSDGTTLKTGTLALV